MSEEARIVHHHHERGHHDHGESDQISPPPPPPPAIPQYGTFEGIPHSPAPAMGFPQPVPPRGAMDPSNYYAHGYQAVPGYVVAEGTPVREREHEHRLPCCGIGFGWFLFIIGFFLAGIPWYVGAFFLICCKRSVDQREKPGYVACTIAAVLAIIAVIFGVTRIHDD
uniref:60S ribosomal protein L18a-like protein n=1 Tax=Opuntia streptacantha TaxID=393608 RepID=A0A7C9DLM6_OPUST